MPPNRPSHGAAVLVSGRRPASRAPARAARAAAPRLGKARAAAAVPAAALEALASSSPEHGVERRRCGVRRAGR